MVLGLLEKNGYPFALEQFGLEGLKALIITIAKDKGRPFTKKKLIESLTMIEDSLKETKN